jgi:hypothetical protein
MTYEDAARMVVLPQLDVSDASALYLSLWREADQMQCRCREHDTTPCGSWLWLDVDAASIAYDLAVAASCSNGGGRDWQEAVWQTRLENTLRSEVAF